MKSSSAILRSITKPVRAVLTVAILGAIIWWLANRRIPVLTHPVTAGAMVAEVLGTGTLEARLEATISPKIQGRLKDVLVDQNDAVTSGQLLAVLEDAELNEQVAVAAANLDSALATIERVRADENRALAVLQQAQLNHARVVDLQKASIAAAADLDKAVELLSIGEADVKRAQAAIVEAERQRLAAQAALKYQQVLRADTRLVSPYAGLVVRRDRDPGDVVVPGSSVLQVIATNELWISAWVDETALGDLAPGQAARVVFRSEPTRSYPGRLYRLGRQTDRETREFLVDVLVRELPTNWAVGQRAEVYIETRRKESALAVPTAFLAWRDGQPGIFVNAEGRARWQPITLGMRGGGQVEAASGLTAGMELLRPAGAKELMLKAGKRVRHQ